MHVFVVITNTDNVNMRNVLHLSIKLAIGIGLYLMLFIGYRNIG